MWQKRCDMTDDPLMFTINLALRSNSPTSRLINQYVMTDVGDVTDDVSLNLRNSDSSRRQT